MPAIKGWTMEDDFLDGIVSSNEEDDFLSGINVTKTKQEEKPSNRGYEDKNKGYNKNYSKKSADTNVKGSNEINLWDKPTVMPLPLDTNKFKTEQKYATVVLANSSYNPTEQERAKFKKIFTSLKNKEYKVRIICNYVRAIHKDMVEILGAENIYHITPWKSYCKEDKTTTMYMPSDLNIRGAANFFKNFQKLNPALQNIMSGIFTTCFGLYNNEPSSMIIMCDPFYDGKKIDFTKSKDTSNYIFLSRALSLDIYNIEDDAKFVDVMKLLN